MVDTQSTDTAQNQNREMIHLKRSHRIMKEVKLKFMSQNKLQNLQLAQFLHPNYYSIKS